MSPDLRTSHRSATTNDLLWKTKIVSIFGDHERTCELVGGIVVVEYLDLAGGAATAARPVSAARRLRVHRRRRVGLRRVGELPGGDGRGPAGQGRLPGEGATERDGYIGAQDWEG